MYLGRDRRATLIDKLTVLKQSHCRFQAKHEVHVLDSRSAGALDEIVYCRNENDSRTIFSHRDIDKVSSRNESRRG